jgi:hypothetical protein
MIDDGVADLAVPEPPADPRASLHHDRVGACLDQPALTHQAGQPCIDLQGYIDLAERRLERHDGVDLPSIVSSGRA